MLVHPDILPDVLALVIPALVVSSLAWWRSAARAKRLERELESAKRETQQLRAENGIQLVNHAGRWTTLKAQYEQTDLLYRSEEALATRLSEFVEEAPVTLRRQSRDVAATSSPYGAIYDGERCQPARIKARLDEMKAMNPGLESQASALSPRSTEPLTAPTGVAA